MLPGLPIIIFVALQVELLFTMIMMGVISNFHEDRSVLCSWI